MHYGQMELSLLSLAWKLGLHPSTLARLPTITTSLPKWMPFRPLHGIGGTFC
jgi:hypothetical protein